MTVAITGYIVKDGKLIKVAERRNKFNAEKVTWDGIEFDSLAEGDRYIHHKLRERAGEITDLRLQPEFELQEGFRDSSGKRQRAITYRADFAYIENGERIIEEVKGFETEAWKLKKKMFLHKYPNLTLRIVKQTRKGQWVEA